MILYNTHGTARRVVQVLDCLYERTQFRVIHVHLDYDPVGKKDGFEQMKAVLRSHKLRSILPTLIVGVFKEGASIIPLLELPNKIRELATSLKNLACPKE